MELPPPTLPPATALCAPACAPHPLWALGPSSVKWLGSEGWPRLSHSQFSGQQQEPSAPLGLTLQEAWVEATFPFILSET